MNFTINGFDLIQPCYIVFSSISLMVQYDYEINLVISTITLPGNKNRKVFTLGTNLLVVSVDLLISPFLDPYLYYYSIDNIYMCGGCVCPNTYITYSDGINCIKGSNPIVPVTPIVPIVPVTPTVNLTNNTQNTLSIPSCFA